MSGQCFFTNSFFQAPSVYGRYLHGYFGTVIFSILICAALIAGCHDSDPGSSSGCKDNNECPEDKPLCNVKTGNCVDQIADEDKCKSDEDCKNNSKTPICNTGTGQCVANSQEEDKCKSDDDCEESSCDSRTEECESGEEENHHCNSNDDCKDSGAPLCHEITGKCVECLRNNDCMDEEKPRCIPETGKCDISTYGKKFCETDGDCTDSYYSKCNSSVHECTIPCVTDIDCKICRNDDKCIDSDVPVCNKSIHLCEAYSDCTIHSDWPCYTKCSEDRDEYIAWLNGRLTIKKCKDKSCTVSSREIGIEPDVCEEYTAPPESCNSSTSAMLCSPSGSSVWACDSVSNVYYEDTCNTETEHCVQCQNRASCIPIENCAMNSTRNCNSVCNEAGDGFYLWDSNSEKVYLHVCPNHDCIHVCGMAECRSGTGYHAGEDCSGEISYCTLDGSFAYVCEESRIVQKKCRNNDCTYNAEGNEIKTCTQD